MVQITPPPTESPTGTNRDDRHDDGIDSAAATQSAIIGPASSTETISPARTAPVPPIDRLELATNFDPLPDDSDVPENDLPVSFQTDATQRARQWVLVGLLASFGLVAAGILFSHFVKTYRENRLVEKSQQAVVAEEVAPAPSDDAREDVTTSDKDESPASVDDSVIPDPATEEPAATTGQAIADPTVLSTTQPNDAQPPTAKPFELSGPTDSLTGVKPPLANATGPLATNPDATDPPPLNNLPKELLKFMPLMSMETSDKSAPTIDAPPTIDTVRIEDATKEVEADEVNPNRKPIDVDKLLNQRFAISSKGASIAELALILSQLTTVPIELDLISLDAAGIAIDSPIQAPTKWMSARQWIDTVCADHDLVATSSGGRLLIAANDAAVAIGLAPALELDDFGDDAAAVFSLIGPLLWQQPTAAPGEEVADVDKVEGAVDAAVDAATTTLGEDGVTIITSLDLASQMRAALCVEAIRLMRDMPTKLPRWRTSRWIGMWPRGAPARDASELAAGELAVGELAVGEFGDWEIVDGGDGGKRLDSPRTAAGLLGSIASLNRANVLVGWRDATRQGLFPADLMMPFSASGTAGDMLDEILGDQGLQARVCGPGLWYVTTEASYDRFEVIAWFAIPPDEADAIRLRLANSLGIADPALMPVIFLDDRMLVRCPRFLARQMDRIISL